MHSKKFQTFTQIQRKRTSSAIPIQATRTQTTQSIPEIMKVLRLFTIIKDPQINMKYLYHGNGLNTEHMKLSRYGNHKETIN